MDTNPIQPVLREPARSEEESISASYRQRFGVEPPKGTVEPLVGVDLPIEVKVQFIRDLETFVLIFADATQEEREVMLGRSGDPGNSSQIAGSVDDRVTDGYDRRELADSTDR